MGRPVIASPRCNPAGTAGGTAAAGYLLLTLLLAAGPARAEGLGKTWNNLAKEDKALAMNLGVAGFITLWGVAQWDYFQSSPRWDSEGWFGRNTPEGGADKTGHAYSGYLLTHVFASRYRAWGYDNDKASLYGSLSSFGVQTFMEVGDSFSGKYGFSPEDFIANAVGSGIGYLTWRYPSLAEKIDLRMEYKPDFKETDVFTDYSHQKILLALKLGGFEPFREGPLSYLELHLGYFSRGYQDQDPGNDRREAYVGIALNLSRLFRQHGFKKTATVLNYYQPPYTYLSLKHDFND